MERVPFLSQIDDEKHYAQLLEVAYCEATTEINLLVHELSSLCRREHFLRGDQVEVVDTYNKLARLEHVMIGTVGDATERRRRLANIT